MINRYFIAKIGGTAERIPNWRESRMLVTPHGPGTTPVLANNNIGLVSLNLKSHTVEHTLFFLKGNKILSNMAIIEFDEMKKDIR